MTVPVIAYAAVSRKSADQRSTDSQIEAIRERLGRDHVVVGAPFVHDGYSGSPYLCNRLAVGAQLVALGLSSRPHRCSRVREGASYHWLPQRGAKSRNLRGLIRQPAEPEMSAIAGFPKNSGTRRSGSKTCVGHPGPKTQRNRDLRAIRRERQGDGSSAEFTAQQDVGVTPSRADGEAVRIPDQCVARCRDRRSSPPRRWRSHAHPGASMGATVSDDERLGVESARERLAQAGAAAVPEHPLAAGGDAEQATDLLGAQAVDVAQCYHAAGARAARPALRAALPAARATLRGARGRPMGVARPPSGRLA